MADIKDAEPGQVAQISDGEKCEAALAHFERLQEQIDSIRSTIPSVVAPLTRPRTKGSANMFAAVQKSAVQASNDLKSFRDNWTSDQTQQLFAQGRESYEKDSDLKKANDVPKYGWSNQ